MKRRQVIYIVSLVLVVALAVMAFLMLNPSMSEKDVQAVVRSQLPSEFVVVSAKHQGQGIWEVKIATPGGWLYTTFDESSGQIEQLRP